MKNFKLLILLGFSLILISFSPLVQAQDLPPDLNSVGVNNGDTFNLLVVDNNLDLSELGVEESDLADLGFDLAQFGIDSLNFEYYDEVNNVTISPEEGDIVVVEVVNVDNRKISLTLDGVTAEVETGFVLGTPVAFTNWDLWETYLGEVKDDVTTQNPDVAITLDFTSSNETNFVAKITVVPEIPVSLSQNINTISAELVLLYNKATGVQEGFQLDITGEGKLSSGFTFPISQHFAYQITNQEPPEPTTTSESNGTGPEITPGFEFAIPLLTIGTVALIINKRKR